MLLAEKHYTTPADKSRDYLLWTSSSRGSTDECRVMQERKLRQLQVQFQTVRSMSDPIHAINAQHSLYMRLCLLTNNLVHS